MKIISADSEVWMFAHQDNLRAPRGLSYHTLINEFLNRYQFLGRPDNIPQDNGGLVFREGRLIENEIEIPIRKMTLYSDGLHITVGAESDFADMVCKDAGNLYARIAGIRSIEDTITYHNSAIVCDFENSIDVIVNNFTEISGLISMNLDISADIHCRSIVFSADPMTLAGHYRQTNPTLFRIEPRDGFEFSKKRYFSFANMTTAKHAETLQRLDEMADINGKRNK